VHYENETCASCEQMREQSLFQVEDGKTIL